MNKKTVAVIFDDNSKSSASILLASLSSERYFTLPIHITNKGKWLFYDNLTTDNINDTAWEKFGTNVVLSPDRTHSGFLRLVGDKFKIINCDIVFPLAQNSAQLISLCQSAGINFIGGEPACVTKTLLRQIAASAKLKKAKVFTCAIINTKKDPIICGSNNEQVRVLALKTHKVLGAPTTALISFVLQENTERLLLRNFETTPNFTPESEYAQLWQNHGFTITELVENLIENRALCLKKEPLC